MKPENMLLRRIGQLPAGEKLPVSRLARQVNCSASVLVGMVERLIADGRLDSATVRPPVVGATIPPSFIATEVPAAPPHASAAAPHGEAETRLATASASPLLPDRPTGAELCAALDVAALAGGEAIYEFIKPLSDYPHQFYSQLREAKRPKLHTVARVRALIAGEDVPAARNKLPDVVTCRREEREERGLPPSGRELRDARQLEQLADKREREAERRMESDVAVSSRKPGETLAEAVARTASEREERFRNATRLTTAHPLPLSEDELADRGLGELSEERRVRELDELASPSSVLRRAQRDWPDQCERVKAIAGELGVTLGEAWRRVIGAGVECLSDPEAA
jgi:hypothetical protein